MGFVKLIKGKDKLAKNFHPWIYSGAIDLVKEAKSGDVVKVLDGNGDFIAYGFYNSNSKIAVRLFEWDERKSIDRDWFYSKIESSFFYRKILYLEDKTNCYRFIFGEADGLPGIVLDKYNEYYVLQLSVKGMENFIKLIMEIIVEKLNPKGIYLKVDSEIAAKEGLILKDEIIYGDVPSELEIIENGLRYLTSIKNGQKTGFFIDQRNNRNKIRKYVENKSVLDVFCYSGGFSLNSLYAHASKVCSIDSSKEALLFLNKNCKINSLPFPKVYNGDAFTILRDLIEACEKYDVVILDPPKLSKKESDKEKAMRAYKDLNMNGMKLLNVGGILVTFSCSGNISREDLKKIIAWASIDSKRNVKIIENLFQSEDHPIRLSYPESEYLKGFVCFVE